MLVQQICTRAHTHTQAMHAGPAIPHTLASQDSTSVVAVIPHGLLTHNSTHICTAQHMKVTCQHYAQTGDTCTTRILHICNIN